MSAYELANNSRINIKSLLMPEANILSTMHNDIKNIAINDKNLILDMLNNIDRSSRHLSIIPEMLMLLNMISPESISPFIKNSKIRTLTLNTMRHELKGESDFIGRNVYDSPLIRLTELKSSIPNWFNKINLSDYEPNIKYVENQFSENFNDCENINSLICEARSYKILNPEKLSREKINLLWNKINFKNEIYRFIFNNKGSNAYYFKAALIANFAVLFGINSQIKEFVNDEFEISEIKSNLDEYKNSGNYKHYLSQINNLLIATADEIKINENGLTLLSNKSILQINNSQKLPLERSFI